MPLASGQTLTFYEILGPLGVGGMGEVYRARDTRLDREVAIKVLPENFAEDEERLRRFEREAKTLASLNHPNVAGIHGVDQAGAICFLALELVPGEDLGTRLERGPLAVAEALDVCRQIAEGLEAAHEAGVVHRDLKPANVRVTPEGVVKVLDFGLAKPIAARDGQGGAAAAESDSFLVTEEGLILGTPTYMSPEQARGKPVDRRTDVWAFGCVLYECLTGKRAFAGGTLTDILAAIVEREPDWSALPALPPRVDELLRRALTKDPRARLRDAGEARVQLQLAQAELEGSRLGATAPHVGAPRARRAAPALAALLGLAVGGALGYLAQPTPNAAPILDGATPAAAAPMHVVLEVLDHAFVAGGIALSPDGTQLAWVQTDGLYLRRLDELSARLLRPVDPLALGLIPSGLAWSPDGRDLAFAQGGGVWRVSPGDPAATPPVLVADDGVPDTPLSLAWFQPDRIAFVTASGSEEVWSVSPLGGEVTALYVADPQATTDFHAVQALPGGELLLVRHRFDVADADTLSILADGELHDVRTLAGWRLRRPCYAGARIVFERVGEGTGSLWSVPFSLAQRASVGEPELVADEALAVAAAWNGTLVYEAKDGRTFSEPVWVDLDGSLEAFAPRIEAEFLLSTVTADEQRVFTSPPGQGGTLWEHDRQRGVSTRVMQLAPGEFVLAGDLPDGRIVRSSWSTGETHLVAPDGSREPELLVDGFAGRMSRDPLRVLVTRGEVSSQQELSLLDVASGEETPIRSVSRETFFPDLSPDGEWVVYTSSESGTLQVYLCRAETNGRRWPVSTESGTQAWFADDGKTIYFATNLAHLGEPLDVWRVDLQTSPDVRLGAPEPVLELDDDAVLVTDFLASENRFVGARRLDASTRKLVLRTAGAGSDR